MDEQLKKRIDELTEENNHLKTAVAELSILNEIATAIRSTQSLQQVVDLIIRKCVKHLQVEQGVVLLLDRESGNETFKTMVREADQSAQCLPYRMDTQLLGWMIKHKKALLIKDCQNDDRITAAYDETCPIKSLLAVPLIQREQLIGLLAMFNKKDNKEFQPNGQRLLTIIAAQSAQIIENARLYEEEQDLFRMQEEMKFAYNIQVKLLPEKPPVYEGYDIAGISVPAKDVGGDYFDFIPVSENKFAFCLGDVSGKGMPAALLMANLQATLRGQALLKNTPAECLFYSNVLLYNSTSPEKFATLFYGIIDTAGNELSFSNAGHDNPLLISNDKRHKRLKTGGIVLGFLDSFKYEQDSIFLEAGDVLLLYSDGITEAMNSLEEEYGEERLLELLQSSIHLGAKEIIDKVLFEVNNFAGEMPQMDDMTIMVIKRLSG